MSFTSFFFLFPFCFRVVARPITQPIPQYWVHCSNVIPQQSNMPKEKTTRKTPKVTRKKKGTCSRLPRRDEMNMTD